MAFSIKNNRGSFSSIQGKLVEKDDVLEGLVTFAHSSQEVAQKICDKFKSVNDTYSVVKVDTDRGSFYSVRPDDTELSW